MKEREGRRKGSCTIIYGVRERERERKRERESVEPASQPARKAEMKRRRN